MRCSAKSTFAFSTTMVASRVGRVERGLHPIAFGLVFAILAAFGVARGVHAQDAKPDEKKPEIKFAIPLVIAKEKETRLTLRGANLGEASEIRSTNPSVTIKLTSKGPAPLPERQDAARIGETQAEADVTVPADFSANEVLFTVVTPQGETVPVAIPVAPAGSLLTEKEPNNGFAEAQPVENGQTIEGVIDGAKTVDVYRLEGRAGQKLDCEVLAARRNSALDPLLMLYDARGAVLAESDDAADLGRDCRLQFSLPSDGPLFLVVMDAHDLGSSIHVYRLTVRLGD